MILTQTPKFYTTDQNYYMIYKDILITKTNDKGGGAVISNWLFIS